MEFLTESWIGQGTLRRHTAPSGMIYNVHAILVTNFSSSSIQFLMTNRYVEEDIDFINREGNIFFAMDGAIDGENVFVSLPEPLKMKYITMGGHVLSNMNLIAIVYYTLKKANLNDLIYEFISRGKSP